MACIKVKFVSLCPRHVSFKSLNPVETSLEDSLVSAFSVHSSLTYDVPALLRTELFFQTVSCVATARTRSTENTAFLLLSPITRLSELSRNGSGPGYIASVRTAQETLLLTVLLFGDISARTAKKTQFLCCVCSRCCADELFT
jgi:hypothetical protein